tara:strand:+ start:6059 stop:6388 length:330 start_codon:yes stop_codon:yes gene_type:complete
MRPLYKSPRIKLPKLQKSAEGKECVMNVEGVCNNDSSTVVLCHSNSSKHGKGMGTKAHDFFAVWGCHACHDWLDGRSHQEVPADVKQHAFDMAHIRQLEIWFRSGILKT